MESAALYTIAARYRRPGADHPDRQRPHQDAASTTTAQEREQTFGQMVEIALDTAIA